MIDKQGLAVFRLLSDGKAKTLDQVLGVIEPHVQYRLSTYLRDCRKYKGMKIEVTKVGGKKAAIRCVNSELLLQMSGDGKNSLNPTDRSHDLNGPRNRLLPHPLLGSLSNSGTPQSNGTRMEKPADDLSNPLAKRAGGWATGPTQGKEFAHRSKKIGQEGEDLSQRHLEDAGFTNVVNLNSVRVNYPGYDLKAERGGEKFFISVKSRNRFERNGAENTRYKLSLTHAQIWEITAEGRKVAWIAVGFEPEKNSYSAFFGYLEQLPRGGRPTNPANNAKYAFHTGIAMSAEACEKYECFAKDVVLSYDISHLKNSYSRG